MVIFHSFWTVFLFVLFLAITVWAWSARRKADFDEAARLPLEDDVMHETPPHREPQG